MINRYAGTDRQPFPTYAPNPKTFDPALYLPPEGLKKAVDVALALGQPLLLTGEPGTGKTQLAHHVAWWFDLGRPHVFNAQTGSVARDLFYRYDALGHFQYAQNVKQAADDPAGVTERFIEYLGLGLAICENHPCVVLVDEIDKAPRDFPNDLLAAIEEMRFRVSETGRSFPDEGDTAPRQRPFIVITSNSEKNLPDAFLRRVCYFHIEFPKPPELLAILQKKVDDFEALDLPAVVEHFRMIREDRVVSLKKNPATAELIHWAGLLPHLGVDTARLADFESWKKEQKEKLLVSYSVLAKTRDDLSALRGMLFGK